MTEKPVNFESAQQRSEWIIQNADYFTAFRMLGRKRERHELKTLDQARAKAKAMLAENGSKAVLIYAVHDVNDTFVEAIGA